MRGNLRIVVHQENQKKKKSYYNLKLTIYYNLLLGDQESHILIKFLVRKVVGKCKF